MGKKILVMLFLLLNVGAVFASENVAGDSAKISAANAGPLVDRVTYKTAVIDQNVKRKALIKVLQKYQSPMVENVDSFIHTCNNQQIDCYLLPAIAGLESYFGRHIYPNSHNPFGWGRGYMMFKDWDQAIEAVGQGLNQNYIGHGAQSIDQIGRIYSESPTWAYRIKRFMAEFKNAEQENGLQFSSFDLQL